MGQIKPDPFFEVLKMLYFSIAYIFFYAGIDIAIDMGKRKHVTSNGYSAIIFTFMVFIKWGNIKPLTFVFIMWHLNALAICIG